MKSTEGYGDRLRSIRGEVGQIDFSKRIGISPGTLSKYENERIPLSKKTLRALSRKLNINSDWLLTGEGQQKIHKVSTELRASYDLEGDAACRESEVLPGREKDFERMFGEDEGLKKIYNDTFGPLEDTSKLLNSMLNFSQKAVFLFMFMQADNPFDAFHIRRKDDENDVSKKFEMDFQIIENLIEKTSTSLSSISPANEDIKQRKKISNPNFFAYLTKLYDKIILDSVKSTFQATGISLPCSDSDVPKGMSLLDFIEFIVRRHSLFELIVIHKAIHDFIVKNPLFSDHVKTMEHPYIDPKALIKSGVLPSSLGIAAQDDEGNGGEGNDKEKG